MWRLLALLTFVVAVNGDCTFVQEAQYSKMPRATAPTFTKPANTTDFATGMQCPAYTNSLVCCSAYQNDKVMADQFQLLDQSFGDPTKGGCPVCAENMKKLWCGFTCDPQQNIYTDSDGTIETRISEGVNQTGLAVNFTVNRDFACQIFTSCKKTAYVAQLSAMNTAEGFFGFQGEKSIQFGILIYIRFTEEGGFGAGMQLPTCDSDPRCGCNSCEAACASADGTGLKSIKPPDTMEGFSWVMVLVVYGVIAVVSLMLLFFRKRRERNGL